MDRLFSTLVSRPNYYQALSSSSYFHGDLAILRDFSEQMELVDKPALKQLQDVVRELYFHIQGIHEEKFPESTT